MGKYILRYDTQDDFVQNEAQQTGLGEYLLEAMQEYEYDGDTEMNKRIQKMYIDEGLNTLVCATTQYCYEYNGEGECYDEYEILVNNNQPWVISAVTPIQNVVPGEGNVLMFHMNGSYYTRHGQGWSYDYDNVYLGTLVTSAQPQTYASAYTGGALSATYRTYRTTVHTLRTIFFSGMSWSCTNELVDNLAYNNPAYKWTNGTGNEFIYTQTRYPVEGCQMHYSSTTKTLDAGIYTGQTDFYDVDLDLIIPETLVQHSNEYGDFDYVDDSFIDNGLHPIFPSLEEMYYLKGVYGNMGNYPFYGYKIGSKNFGELNVTSVVPGVACVNESEKVYYNPHASKINVEYYLRENDVSFSFMRKFSGPEISANDLFGPFCELTSGASAFSFSVGDRLGNIDDYSFYPPTANTPSGYLSMMDGTFTTYGFTPKSFVLNANSITFNSLVSGKVVRIKGPNVWSV